MEFQDQPMVTPNWLRERMRRELEEEMDPTQELERLLGIMDKLAEKKATRKFSKITRDEFGSKMLHLAEPRVDKDRSEITLEEYLIREVNLGHASTTQVVEDFEESSLAVKEKMRKMKKLKSENEVLCDYVWSFKHPLREEDPFFVLPSSLPKESIDGTEEVKKRAQCSKEWVEDVFTSAGKFIDDLARSHSRILSILNRLQSADRSWEDVHIYQDLTISRLKALMKIPRQTLIDEKVVQENDVYDFPWWFYAICIGKGSFERFNDKSISLKDPIRKVQGEFFNAIEALFARRLTE